METENRSILIFFCIIVLLIFLDHQSAHQMRLVGAKPIISKVDSLRSLTETDLNSVGEEIENQADLNQRIFQPAVEKGSA
ncbi:MAG: hypothetical protein H3C43_06575, partial [Leptonema sp. (in: Bacteria)]|nr:hypothetical protein [Leptonema sp. (in: bacteria)]